MGGHPVGLGHHCRPPLGMGKEQPGQSDDAHQLAGHPDVVDDGHDLDADDIDEGGKGDQEAAQDHRVGGP